MGDRGEGLHIWMWSEADRTGWDGTAVAVLRSCWWAPAPSWWAKRMFDLGEELWGDPPPFHDNPVFVVTHRGLAAAIIDPRQS